MDINERSEYMQEMVKSERPYEKCLCYGAEVLSNTELLAVLLRTGTKGLNVMELSKQLLCLPTGEENLLNIHYFTLQKLKDFKVIGDVKAIQILCLSELAKRLAKASVKERVVFQLPSTVAEYYMEEMRHLKQESMKLLMLNTKGKLLGETNVSKGTVNASLITPRELFLKALECEAVSIILIHNHPSGDPTPSHSDVSFTKRVKEAGELIGIDLLDHIIIGNNRYTSFAEQKLI